MEFQSNNEANTSDSTNYGIPLISENINKNDVKEDLPNTIEEEKELDIDVSVQLNDICRGCLRITTVKNMQQIFIGGMNIITMYENISKIKMEFDNLPTMICSNCIGELTKSNNFIKMLQQSATILNKAIHKIKTLNEKIKIDTDLHKMKNTISLTEALGRNHSEKILTGIEEIEKKDENQSHEIFENDIFGINNADSSSSDDLPLSHKFKLNAPNISTVINDNEMELNKFYLTKKRGRKRKSILENLQNNNKIIDKQENDNDILTSTDICPICCKKIRHISNHLQLVHLTNWNESRCLKCSYHNEDKEKLAEHCRNCVKTENPDNPVDGQVEYFENKSNDEEDDDFNDDADQDFELYEERDDFEEDENDVKAPEQTSGNQSIILHSKGQRKTYICNKCEDVDFPNYKHIESHLKTDHAEEKSCILCYEKFTNSLNVLYHMMVKHGKLKCCRLCLVSFKNSEELHAHYKSEEHNTKCTVCKEEFKNRKSLYEHRRKKHLNPQLENQKYKCPKCPKEFANSNNIRRHIMVAHNDQRFLCDTCGQSYTTKRNLKLHIQKFHEGIEVQNKVPKKNFFCEACGRELKIFHKYAIALHVAKHKGHNFVCKKCYDSFSSEDLFEKHVEESGHELFKCDKCASQFVREENFKIHLKNHDAPGWNKNMFATWGKSAKLRNEKGEFVCSYCPKVFKDKQRLDNHVRVHTNERPYKCHICSKGFKTWIHRKTHLNIHLGIKKWVCKYCSKAFTNSCTLKGHEMLHTGERPHHCPECEKGFITTSAMKKHQMVHFRNSNYSKKDKVIQKDEEKVSSDHEEHGEFLYKYGQIFSGTDVNYDESFTDPPKESVSLVAIDKELSC
ncbi:unnamed protein product [Ceutorhynchus assimilis]|uniref:Uncharacterized protein n=1 Tax=Ceutorhynchus assimilis TaxID=467358 RepID=A0A9N9QI14_9CUCU|nr:unnamed protein product [Ceutorhynchus assimilis]